MFFKYALRIHLLAYLFVNFVNGYGNNIVFWVGTVGLEASAVGFNGRNATALSIGCYPGGVGRTIIWNAIAVIRMVLRNISVSPLFLCKVFFTFVLTLIKSPAPPRSGASQNPDLSGLSSTP